MCASSIAAHRRCTSASSMGVPTSVLWPILRRAGDSRLSRFGVTGLCSSVRPRTPLASRRRIPLSALQGEKFIAFSPDLPTRREIDRKLRSEGVKVKLVLEFDNIETVKRAVEIENGVSIVPETAVRDEVAAGLLATVEFSDPELRRPLGALIRRSARVSPALREFLALLEQTTTSEADSSSEGKSKT
jgi:LysR family transcriptional regulator, transcriptional activator of the cysJI operon